MKKYTTWSSIVVVLALVLIPLATAKNQDDHQGGWEHGSGAQLPHGSGAFFPQGPHGSGAQLPPEHGSGAILPPPRSATGATMGQPNHGSGATLSFPGKHFGDINNHWARTYIQLLADEGIVNGDGTNFSPDALVTRAEFVKMLIKALNLPSATGATMPFTDVAATAWYAPYVQQAYAAGWIHGYADSTFRPDQNLTRAEAATILAKALQMSLENVPESGFDDTAKLWAHKYIAVLRWQNLVSGYDNRHFGPEKNITRAEAAKMICKGRDWRKSH